jgi:hypothetical protein
MNPIGAGATRPPGQEGSPDCPLLNRCKFTLIRV